MTRCAVGLPVVAGTLAVLSGWPARAQGSACARLATEAEASVSARWPGLLGTVQEAFDGREDIDRCARVKLRSREGIIAVEVVLPDGRFASRSASLPEDVVPTLEALLLLPRRMPPPPAMEANAALVPTEAPSPPPAPSRNTGDVPVNRAVTLPAYDALPSSAPAPSHLRIELSVATGARIGDGQRSVGIGALSFLDLSGWLVGFEGRLDRYQRLGSSSDWEGPVDGASTALELAVLGGRRVRLHNLAFDFLAGPAAAIQGTTTSQTQTQAGTVTQSSSSDAPRLLLATRLNFAVPATVCAFVSLDGEFGPSRIGGGDLPDGPRLPLWTLGLAVGATVGTR